MSSQGLPLNARRMTLVVALVSVLVFLLMLTHQSTPAEILGRYSTRYVTLLGAMLACLVLATFACLVAWTNHVPNVVVRLPRTHWFAWTIVVSSTLLVGLVWILLRTSSQPAPLLFRLYITGLVVVSALILLRLSGTSDLVVSSKFSLYISLLAAALALVLTILYIGKIPPSLAWDEPIIVDLIVTVFEDHTYLPKMFPAFNGMSGFAMPNFSVPVLYLTGGWLQLVGVGLAQTRLFYLLIGWVSIPFIYLTARRLYGAGAALGALVIAVFIPLLHNYARLDMLTTTVFAVSLYLFFSARHSGKPTQHYLTGLTTGFTLEGHPYAVSFVVAFGLIYAWEYLREVWKTRRWDWRQPFWYLALGLLTYAIYFLAFRVAAVQGWEMLSPTNLLDALLDNYRLQVGFGGGNPLLPRLLLQVPRHYETYFITHPVEVAISFLAVLGSLSRRWASDCSLLALWLLAEASFILLLTHNNPYYWIFHLPFIAILGGALIAQIGTLSETARTQLSFGTLTGIGTVGALLLTHTILTTHLSRGQSSDPLIEIGHEIDALLPPDMVVSGHQIYYLGMPQRRGRFFSTENFGVGSAETWGVPLPEAVIVTRGIDDDLPVLWEYIEAKDLRRAYCFPTQLFGGGVELYLPEQHLPQNAPVNCDHSGIPLPENAIH